MNDSDPVIELARNEGNPIVPEANCPAPQMDPHEVDNYMRDAARMLYNILRDYLKDQHVVEKSSGNRSPEEAMRVVKGRTS